MKYYLVTIEIDNVLTNIIVKAENDEVALINAREEVENNNNED